MTAAAATTLTATTATTAALAAANVWIGPRGTAARPTRRAGRAFFSRILPCAATAAVALWRSLAAVRHPELCGEALALKVKRLNLKGRLCGRRQLIPPLAQLRAQDLRSRCKLRAGGA